MSEKALIPRQNIRGQEFPLSYNFTREKIEAALDYSPRDDDIIISTYPKCGTTWIQYIIYEIMNNGQEPPALAELFKKIPFMEKSNMETVEQLAPPRVLKYHLPYNLTPYNPKTKYITIIRNPYDVVVSYYYFFRQLTTVNLTFDDYFNAFLTGNCIFGDYFDHILSWYPHRNDDNVLVLSYEKMKKDPRTGLILILEFLGYDLIGKEDLIDRILKYTSFEYLKANVETFVKEELHPDKRDELENGHVDFFRSGSVGEGKHHMNKTQEKMLMNRIDEKLKGFDIHHLWS